MEDISGEISLFNPYWPPIVHPLFQVCLPAVGLLSAIHSPHLKNDQVHRFFIYRRSIDLHLHEHPSSLLLKLTSGLKLTRLIILNLPLPPPSPPSMITARTKLDNVT